MLSMDNHTCINSKTDLATHQDQEEEQEEEQEQW